MLFQGHLTSYRHSTLSSHLVREMTNLARQNEDAKSKFTSEVEHANHGDQNMKNDRPSTDAAVIEEFAANYGNRNTRCIHKLNTFLLLTLE
ncbi:hypothetical protein MTR67_029533 [Solanum verrucosum]|uniref:Uncharacterized protein n=1 Tax=Solanum verrucosum TaxID=315347 RepID=A0AAF0R7N4_SOLVR|nr:hypothetical protein MTR67_029533 [Solanum verrucosum]